MIRKYYFSQWLTSFKKYSDVWARIQAALTAENEQFDFIPDTADIWVRDFMPFQRFDGDYVVYRYNPDYLQGKAAKYITDCGEAFRAVAGDEILTSNKCHHTDLVIDGGNMIKCVDRNGAQCVIMTSKVLYENPTFSRKEILIRLCEILDAEVILIPWDTEEPYGHSDGMIRSIGNGKLLMNCYQDMDAKLWKAIVMALGSRFEIVELSYGTMCREKSWCHLNYLELRDAILVPTANIASDKVAISQIGAATGKRCIPISMSKIIAEGGAMHCISWSMDK